MLKINFFVGFLHSVLISFLFVGISDAHDFIFQNT